MSSVLCMNYNPIVKPGGGPPGYLYNLKIGLESLGIRDIVVSSYMEFTSRSRVTDTHIGIGKSSSIKPIIRTIKNNIKQILVPAIKRVSGSLLDISILFSRIINEQMYYPTILDDIFQKIVKYNPNILHFHSTKLLLMFLTSINGHYIQKDIPIILTSHSGFPPSIETTNSISQTFGLNPRITKQHLLIQDMLAFKYADYILVPTIHSIEEYYKYIPGFRAIIKEKKILEVLTGIDTPHSSISREEYREIMGWGEETFVVAYIGRYNYDRGFDIYLQVANKFRHRDDVIFVSAGQNYTSKRYKSIINLGWLSDPFSLINAVDVVVLPNRCSFFDIVALETLGLGTLLIVTDRGGNKILRRYTKGVFVTTADPNSIAKQLNEILKLNSQKRERLEFQNKYVFLKNFTAKHFAERYRNTIREILS